MEPTILESEPQPFYALIELMGHARVVGLVSETKLAGAGFLQVEILDKEGKIAFQRFIAPQAVYQISPIGREMAIELCGRWDQSRIETYDVPELREKIRAELKQQKEADRVPWDPPDDNEPL
jgi:hypothetical protein